MSGGFLDRWSRRKGQEMAAKALEDASAPAEAEPKAESGTPPPPEPPPVLSDEELAALPRIEDLTPQSSLLPFLRAGVPASLKNAAMRRMWLLTPAIRDHKDCAVDYHWDWNTPGGVPGSGGPLEPGSVEKMLKALTEPRAPAPPATDSNSNSNESDAAPEAPPETPVAIAPPAETPRPAAAPDAGPATDASDTLPRRRHGGARPV